MSQHHEDLVKALPDKDDLHADDVWQNTLDLGRAAQYKMAIVQSLTDVRTDAGAEDLLKRAMTSWEENHIQHPIGLRQTQKVWMFLWWSKSVAQPPI